MSDFFSRLIERTMGYAETVQPLISPVYGGLSKEETTLNLSSENLARIEESENINTVKNPLSNLSFLPNPESVRDGIGNPSFNLMKKDSPKQVRGMTSPEEVLLNSRVDKIPDKDIENNFRFTERDIDKQDTESLTEKENIAIIDSKNKSTERFSLNLLPEVKSAPMNKSSDAAHSMDSRETDIKEEGPSDHLLPLAFKNRLSSQKTDNIEYKKNKNKINIYSDLKLSQEPTVKVNIGRIEVRAIIQQKIKQRPALKLEPKLSLDEYLKQRKSGER